MTASSPILVDGRPKGNGVRPADDLLAGVPLRSRLNRVTASLDRTPGKLWAARVGVVGVLLVTFLVAVVSAAAGVGVVHRIETRWEPLSADIIEVYRQLADADATVAAEFQSSEPDVAGRERSYSDDLDRATKALVHAGTLAGAPSLRTRRIEQITRELVTYNGLVERARIKKKSLGLSAGEVSAGVELKRASDVMHSTILRLLETLQRTESENLDAEYRRARAWPIPALAFGVVSVVMLAALQLVLFHTTRRILNVGLVVATVAVLGGALWWAAALSASSSHLENARRHSQAVTDAFGEAQIAARQARATELLLQVPDSEASERDFADKAELLLRIESEVIETPEAMDGQVIFGFLDSSTGGALGVATKLARSSAERDVVDKAIGEAEAWMNAHGTDVKAERAAFEKLDGTLTVAIDLHDNGFEGDVRRSAESLAGLVVGTAALGLLAAALAAWGITLRMKEYR
ncbi:MAG: hypothetical protein ACR2KK_17100 [Acidimicrobiales bacterium]